MGDSLTEYILAYDLHGCILRGSDLQQHNHSKELPSYGIPYYTRFEKIHSTKLDYAIALGIQHVTSKVDSAKSKKGIIQNIGIGALARVSLLGFPRV